jgi:hypothetical protein
MESNGLSVRGVSSIREPSGAAENALHENYASAHYAGGCFSYEQIVRYFPLLYRSFGGL